MLSDRVELSSAEARVEEITPFGALTWGAWIHKVRHSSSVRVRLGASSFRWTVNFVPGIPS